MSIAISAVVKSSRLASALLAILSVGSAAIGLAIVCGTVSELPFLMRAAIAIGCMFAACYGLCSASSNSEKRHHIDISGIGKIRLVEYNALADSTFPDAGKPVADAGEVVSLMGDSTLWSFLLLLRFTTENRRVKTILILPDSVDRDVFRALSVACRWIVAHNNPAERAVEKNGESW
jgi:toxin CptA